MAGKYKSVSTAEKRAMLEAAGEEWPVGSDGLPMVWKVNSTCIAGGFWKLRSTIRAQRREWCARNPEWRESQKKYKRAWAKENALRLSQYDTHRHARKQLEKSRLKTENLYA